MTKVKRKVQKEKKIRTHNLEGIFVLSKNNKIKSLGKDFCIAKVTSKDLERLAKYTQQRKRHLKNKQSNFKSFFVVRLSPDVVFLIDDRKNK